MSASDFTSIETLRFGHLTAVAKRTVNRKGWFLCRCRCGREKAIRADSVTRGTTRTCGCESRKRTHGQTRTPLHRVWSSMIQRCTNPNDGAHRFYGARGVSVCERWLRSFEAFRDDMGPRPPGAQIDRKDNGGPYAPENCRWATRKENCRNRRDNRLLTCGGRTQSLAAWAEETGLSDSVIRSRIDRYGWSVADAVATPSRKSPARAA